MFSILLEQAGLPIAGAPLLMLIGALTGSESVSIPLALIVAASASVFVDCAWFDLGCSRKSNPDGAFKRLRSVDARSFRIGHLFTDIRWPCRKCRRQFRGSSTACAVRSEGLKTDRGGEMEVRFLLASSRISATSMFLELVRFGIEDSQRSNL